MAQTNNQLPLAVVPNTTTGVDWLDPSNILLVDGDFAVATGSTQILTVGNFPINLSQGDTVTNIVVSIKGYRGSFNTTLQIFAIDDTSGVEISYPMLPTFQGFNGTNTLYALTATLFATTWTVNQINNIKIRMIANGELHMDAVMLNVIYTPVSTSTVTLYYNTLTGGPFQVGETITGSTSGATGTVVTDNTSDTMTLDTVTGTFQIGETITGGTTGATAVVTTAPSTGLTVCDEFVQAQRFQLAQSMITTDLFAYLNSFAYSDGTLIAFADFHGAEALLVIDEGVPLKEETVRITAVDQNYNGTGLCRLSFGTLNNRGLLPRYPYTTDSNLRVDHSGTAEVVISNPAAFYNRFIKKCQADALFSIPVEIDDEGVAVTTSVHKINFTGAGVTATLVSPHQVRVDIPIAGGAQAAIQFEDQTGTHLGSAGTATEVELTGSVVGTRVGNKVTYTISGSSGLSSGASTKDTSVNTTTTIAHGLGSSPRIVRLTGLYAAQGSRTIQSYTYATYVSSVQSSLSQAVWDNVSGAGATSLTQTFRITTLNNTGVGDYIEGIITVDATNITITWTLTGTPTGTANLVWEAQI